MDASLIQIQMAAIFVIFIVVCLIAAARDKRAPADDIGVMFLLSLLLYTIIPSLFWMLHGQTYDSFNSGRLLLLQPEPEDISTLLSIALAYAIGFSLIYIWQSRRIPIPNIEHNEGAYISEDIFSGAFLIYLFSVGIGLFLNFGSAVGSADKYIDQHRAIHELPLALRMLFKFSMGWGVVARFVVLVALLQRWPLYRGWFILYVLSIAFFFDPSGTRTGTVLNLLVVLVGWHMLVRPIPVIRWLSMFGAGLFAFLVLGTYRDSGDWGFVWQTIANGNIPLGELDALWANGVELLQAKNLNGFDLPLAVYFSEFFSFIPGEFLPFEKNMLESWYLDTFYWDFKQEGGGWAFGAISQAVVGWGALDAFVRGCLLGMIATAIMRWVRSSRVKWWSLPMFLYLFAFTYQTVRNTTFVLLGDTIQIIIPALCIIYFVSKFFTKKGPEPISTNTL